MKYNCDVIQDLLPLYQDQVCSDASKTMVEEHLNECEKCKDIADKLKDTGIDIQFIEEKNEVLSTHAKRERRKSITIGGIFAGVLMVPVIVCLICNLATGQALDWFFIVFTSLLVFASLSVVPLMVRRNAGMWTIISFVFSLVLLLMTCCIYTGSNWFWVATIPTIFGLMVIFLPYILYHISLPKFFQNKKGLISMVCDTVMLYAVIVVCGIYSNGTDYWRIAFEITTYAIILPWVIFLVVRYLRVDDFIKVGILNILVGLFTASMNDFVKFILGQEEGISIFHADFSDWSIDMINANVNLICLLGMVFIGVIFLIIGVKRVLKKRKN